MMNQFGSHGFGMGWGWIVAILVLIALFWFISRMLNSGKIDHNQKNSSTPLDILKRRYAKGEIDKEEFEQRKKDLL